MVQPIASAAILVTLGCVAGSDGVVAEGMTKAGLEPPSCYDELNETINQWADAHGCAIAEAQRQGPPLATSLGADLARYIEARWRGQADPRGADLRP